MDEAVTCAQIRDIHSWREQKKPTILCIDDDPEITSSIEMRLSNYEVNLVCNYTGMQGIWQAVRLKPDLIISDIRMPQGDGEYLLECIRQNPLTSEIPVILLSGQRGQELHSRVRKLGASRLLQKPIHYSTLIDAIRKFVNLRKKVNT